MLPRNAPTPQSPSPSADDGRPVRISWGDPKRKKNPGAALSGSKKPAPGEARAAARSAPSERPPPTPPLPTELRPLREVGGGLKAVVRQGPRLINQLHHLLALT